MDLKNKISMLQTASKIGNSIVFDEKNSLKISNGTESSVLFLYQTKSGEDFFKKTNEDGEFENIGIYDLTEFISILKVFNPDKTKIDFKSDFILISEGNKKVKYMYSDESVILNKCKPFSKYTKVIEEVKDNTVEFDIEFNDISDIMKTANILQNEIIKFKKEDENKISVIVQKQDLNSSELILELEIDDDNVDIPDDFDTKINAKFLSYLMPFEKYNIKITDKFLVFSPIIETDEKILYIFAKIMT